LNVVVYRVAIARQWYNLIHVSVGDKDAIDTTTKVDQFKDKTLEKDLKFGPYPVDAYVATREVKNESGTASADPYNEASFSYRNYWADSSRELDEWVLVSHALPTCLSARGRYQM
jgi:hypothetical protein